MGSRAAAPSRSPEAQQASDLLIAAKQLSVGYGSGLVVRDLDLEVRPGEVVALLGPNGAGKTTTLLALAGELRPVSGEIVWNGSPRWSPLHRRARQGMAFIPEDRSVFGRLTTMQNLLVKRQRDPEATLQMFPHLRGMLSRPGRLLSGGEQRMLAVGRAISGDTKLLLADELTLGLAPLTSNIIFQAIRRAADQGLGALIVEQHVHRVLKIADRVYVMERGRIRLSTSAEQARAQLEDIQSLYLSGPSTPNNSSSAMSMAKANASPLTQQGPAHRASHETKRRES